MARFATLVAISIAGAIASARSFDDVAAHGLLAKFQIRATTGSNLSTAAAAALAYERSNFVGGSVLQDPFYSSLPPSAATAAPGSLLKLEDQSNTNTKLWALPPTTALSRFVYQSKNLNGSSVPVSAFILWPYSPRKLKDGTYPVVAWAHGTSGIANECAPSHIINLWQHFEAPYLLAMQGYVVVATDYAGLGVPIDARNNTIVHEYLAGPSQANDVVYSVQAARTAYKQLSKNFVVVGHSQGGGAAWAVAQRQVKQPVDGYLGAVAVSPVTSILQQVGPIAPFLGTALAPGAAAVMTGFKTTDITTAPGQQAIDLLLEYGGCSGMADAVLAQAPSLLQPNWQQNGYITQYQKLISNGGQKIAKPLLVFHGENDPLLNFNVTVAAVAATAKLFPDSQLEFHQLPGVSHVPALQASQPTWMDWIAARFAGESVPDRTVISTATPARPLAAQETELDWYIALATAFYQTP